MPKPGTTKHHRREWRFPQRATRSQKEAARTWLTVITPYIGQSFTANFEMKGRDLIVRATGDAGGEGLVRITYEADVLSMTTGKPIQL